MTSFELLQLRIGARDDVTGVRHVAGRAAAGLGLDRQNATRVATSVSEIGRVGARQESTTVTFTVETGDGQRPPQLAVRFRFGGPSWRPQLRPGTPVHDAVHRLMDDVVLTDDGVCIAKSLPAPPAAPDLVELRHRLLADRPGDLRSVLQSQNTELVSALVALRDREADLLRLNVELEQTNRGVVALYAELERRAAEVRTAQRGVFEELERALRPPPPLVPGLELDVRYLPSQANSPTGGDLYDWLALPDGTVHLAVVDVAGHGVASTRDALQVTHTVRTLVQEGHDLRRVLQRADTLLQLPGRPVFATSLVVRIDPRDGTVELAGAGHPPALLLAADGAVRYLDAPGRPLGYPGAGSLHTARVQLAAGDCLLLYTDGLIEIRHDILEGLQTLESAALKAAGLEVPQLLDTVLAACTVGHPLQDDTLALAVRWHPDVPGPRGTDAAPALVLPGTVDAPALARRYVHEQARALPAQLVDDATVLVSELVGNAVRHGAAPIRLMVTVTDRGLSAAVHDGGAPFAPEPGAPPRRGQDSGRGLFLVEALARRWGVRPDEGPGGGKAVWFEI